MLDQLSKRREGTEVSVKSILSYQAVSLALTQRIISSLYFFTTTDCVDLLRNILK